MQANGIVPKPPPVNERATASEETLDLTAGDYVQVKPEPVGEGINDTTQRSVALSKRLNPNCVSEARPAKRVKQEKKFVPTGEVIDLT